MRGEFGPGARIAMSILVRMAQVYRAKSLLDIVQAHIDSSVYVGPANLEFAERLAGLNAKVAVPTTLNVSGVDEYHWKEWAVPADWANQARRQMVAYQSMGCIPTWTCAPYQNDTAPKFGDQIAWGESNAIVYANSVIGARTERYPDLLDACCAITGRAPAVGLHLTENRAGHILLRLSKIPARVQETDTFYTVLGYLIGRIAQEGIPVIEGLTIKPTDDQLKHLGATASSAGRVALFHIVDVTPEAPTLESAFQNRSPLRTIEITMDDLRASWRELSSAEGDRLDMVVLGSPHFSLGEFRQLTQLIAGKHCQSEVQFLVTSSRGVVLLAKRAGFLDALISFGGRVTVDTCILTSPMLPPSIKRIMTNSGKYSYYSPGLLGLQVIFGSLEDCVESAIRGRVIRDGSIWN
jgi:predicted aconitase